MTLVRGGPRPLRDPRLVELPPDRLERAEAVGKLRFLLSKSRGERDTFNDDSEASHIMGASGEAAFCFAYGIPWAETIDGYDEVPDLEPNWEIRTTRSLQFLKVRNSRKDKPDRRVTFVLKQGENRWLILTRFIRAGDAQKRYRKRDPGERGAPAHFVPIEALVPIIDLPHTIHVWWPVAGEPGHWECFFGHEVWRLEDHAAIYEWPHPSELVRRPKAARPAGDVPGPDGPRASTGDGGVPPDAPNAVHHRRAGAPADQVPAVPD